MREWFARKSNNRLRQMLQSVRSRDFSLRMPEERLHGSERELAKEINNVLTDFRRQMLNQERRYGHYEAILDTITTAIIIADENGDVGFMNRKAVESLCGFRINNITSLAALDPELPAELRSLAPGDVKLHTLKANGKEFNVKISMVRYCIDGEYSYLYSIEDVYQLMLQNEIEAQRKLVRVLTHEIMNSLSPIISLSDSLCKAISNPDEETAIALKTIYRRGQGLLSFVENYRKLSRVSAPKLEWVKIDDIFNDMSKLFPETFITYIVSDPDLQLRIDRDQILQVMINLIKNAIEACEDNPAITVSSIANHSQRCLFISVADNGCGINVESEDSVFLPFYTTKPDGSGIGLSISRQIITQHGGSIKFEPADVGAKVTIRLPLIEYRI